MIVAVLREQQVKEDELESWELYAELREQGDYERLVAHCEEEADRSPGDLQALERLGNAYVLNGNYQKAVRGMLGSRSPGMGEASGQDVGPPDELQGVERHPPPAAAAGLAVQEDDRRPGARGWESEVERRCQTAPAALTIPNSSRQPPGRGPQASP